MMDQVVAWSCRNLRVMIVLLLAQAGAASAQSPRAAEPPWVADSGLDPWFTSRPPTSTGRSSRSGQATARNRRCVSHRVHPVRRGERRTAGSTCSCGTRRRTSRRDSGSPKHSTRCAKLSTARAWPRGQLNRGRSRTPRGHSRGRSRGSSAVTSPETGRVKRCSHSALRCSARAPWAWWAASLRAFGRQLFSARCSCTYPLPAVQEQREGGVQQPVVRRQHGSTPKHRTALHFAGLSRRSRRLPPLWLYSTPLPSGFCSGLSSRMLANLC